MLWLSTVVAVRFGEEYFFWLKRQWLCSRLTILAQIRGGARKNCRAVTSFHFIGDNKHTSASASGLSNNGFAFGRCLGGMFAINTSSREPGTSNHYLLEHSETLYSMSQSV
jgi:hypothetical protein